MRNLSFQNRFTKVFPVAVAFFLISFASCSKLGLNGSSLQPATSAADALKNLAATPAALPVAPDNKIAYYAFDATPTGNPVVNLPLTDFANTANEVVLFEGTAWELADSVHYGSDRDRKSTRLNSSHLRESRMPSSA